MSTGRNDHIANGGHSICLHGTLIPNLEGKVEDIWNRMFKDNGHKSIQTAIATGTLKFQEIDSKLAALSVEVKSLSAHVSSLADTIRQANKLTSGIACEGLTVEGLVREVLSKLPATSGSSTTAMWVSLAVVSLCATTVFLKVW
jgi:hypothetical protein